MFPTQKLFRDDLCPNYTACSLFNCIYSHSPITPLVGVRTQSTGTSNSSSTRLNPPKRSGPALESTTASKVTKRDSGSASSSSNAPHRPVASTSKVQLPQTPSQRVLVDVSPSQLSSHSAMLTL